MTGMEAPLKCREEYLNGTLSLLFYVYFRSLSARSWIGYIYPYLCHDFRTYACLFFCDRQSQNFFTIIFENLFSVIYFLLYLISVYQLLFFLGGSILSKQAQVVS